MLQTLRQKHSENLLLTFEMSHQVEGTSESEADVILRGCGARWWAQRAKRLKQG